MVDMLGRVLLGRLSALEVLELKERKSRKSFVLSVACLFIREAALIRGYDILECFAGLIVCLIRSLTRSLENYDRWKRSKRPERLWLLRA